MLKIQEIREIIKLVDSSSVDEFVFEHDDTKLKLKKNSGTTVVSTTQAAPVAVAPVVEAPKAPEAPKAEVVKAPEAPKAVKEEVVADANLHKITSPMVGTFYASPNPESPAFVKAGDKVGEESIVCIVEAMKLFNEIEAEVTGEIVEVLVENGELVEYGQPLFLVKEA
ncbi:MAG: acetyl-CoA carboxylase biotin carboxyl carrier protein [Kurthia sp.]|uniref:Biotin carboxyl carrier protein of acetyl-CoA carboxylase n=1 Tax=Kurthia zopfii TaxID=1650 RepID=A0A8B4QBE3_9BACL|nr:acetyl-CoA carboxylase biotin carboxyl carrier protein [Kurthia zopfii]PWI21975.1 acetyl-CoA carboxylase biotin carboxyl carrier protein [Kurthia zopfii]TDR36644.1 acetyl-CoA carboxylase biotin carboxyl carrier protein [Kurthia zopfii]GEK30999.1 biotin carboxyl carrier protein of acetyl-CoA carboxylase [Kurthia zopfii]STX09978.1 Biotin carboxyl carrier protein of acetyl-CoA carboxylase [Kurthia zopfii]